MQCQPTTHTGSSAKAQQSARSDCAVCGEQVAQLFRYYRSLQNPYKSKSTPLKLVSGKSLYLKHTSMFDTFAKMAAASGFDIGPYIKYCVSCGIDESTLSTCLASTTMIDKYAAYVKRTQRRKMIYKWFLKSASNIATKCIECGWFTTKDFLRDAIESHRIGELVITGEVSLYFFAALPKFKDAISRLDYFSQQELAPLSEHFDIYHSEVNKAFLQEKNTYVNPIKFTDDLIWDMRNKQPQRRA